MYASCGHRIVADQHRVALRVVAGIRGGFQDLHKTAITCSAAAGADAFADDVLRVIAADVDHLRAGVGLLAAVGQRDGVELADAVVALQDAAGVFPGDRTAGFHLRPGDLAVYAAAGAALGDEVVDAAFAGLRVTGVPVLTVLYLMLALSSATSSTTAAWSWFSSRIGAVQPRGSSRSHLPRR
jgi:hypothetical protein